MGGTTLWYVVLIKKISDTPLLGVVSLAAIIVPLSRVVRNRNLWTTSPSKTTVTAHFLPVKAGASLFSYTLFRYI